MAATRALFQTLCLSPSMNSVARLSNVAERPDLASQVRTLRIHRHYLKAVSFDEYIRSDHLAESLQQLPPLDAASHALELSRAFKDELDAQLRFKTEGPPLLSQALKKFPRLQCFVHCGTTTQTVEGDYLLDKDSDLVRRTGVRILDGEKHYLLMNSTLQKCRGLKPASVDWSSFYWWEFHTCMGIPHAKALLERVTHFKLTFEVKSFAREPCPLKPTSGHWRQNLTNALARLVEYLSAVGHLWLGFDEMDVGYPLVDGPQYIRSHAVRRMTSLLLNAPNPAAPLPRLTSLTLENTAVRLGELCGFIVRHSGQLRSLTIVNMRLHEAGMAIRGVLATVMKLISFLHTETQLDQFVLQGTFQGLHAQLLCCPQGKGSILHDLQEYVCHRGEFPFCSIETSWECATPVADNVTIPDPRNCRANITIGSDASWYFEASDALDHQ
ncbi:uncharacterized protein Z520_05069 [Fonsecaea multimorphosa CBS 102226]|uniref:Uncharacterized protein n=1 Tax=Fonsecaea multimorphosa CBS 102226 TaxID=1442371 RepID=A0A0D2KS43_9EURO|nr:uncharacterized protein Z520_05069 [Fonsecaea multimorphosa CBS 102226]KIX99493.1 hypothetical protein Z520_05069 [Fonsecaea multimorphosa CBS 102226]